MSRKLIWQRNHKGTMETVTKRLLSTSKYIEEVKHSCHRINCCVLRRQGAGGAVLVSRNNLSGRLCFQTSTIERSSKPSHQAMSHRAYLILTTLR